MIRDTRVYIATQAICVLLALMALTVNSLGPPTNGLFPPWILIGLFLVVAFGCTYNIYVTLKKGAVPRAKWTEKFSDKQLWTFKAVVIAALLFVVAAVVLYQR